MSDLPKMQYVRLGNSGLKVSKIILGMMSYGSKGWQGWVLEEEDALKHVKAAYDAGIQTFDTADVYSNGLSEIILGSTIRKLNLPREELVIMTKLFVAVMPEFGIDSFDPANVEKYRIVNQKGLSRKHIFDAVKASLRRLQVDYIDVLQCHRFDDETPISEIMHALHDVVKAGYVRYIGMSTCHAYEFHAMQNYAITNNLTPFISMQNHYNLLYREEEREMMPTLKMFGVGSIPWSPLARGLLTRSFEKQKDSLRANTDPWAGGYNGRGTPDVVKRVEELATKKGVTMAQIAIAWVLSKPGVCAPVIGTTKLENLYDTIRGIDVTLTDEEIKYLEEPYQPTAVYRD